MSQTIFSDEWNAKIAELYKQIARNQEAMAQPIWGAAVTPQLVPTAPAPKRCPARYAYKGQLADSGIIDLLDMVHLQFADTTVIVPRKHVEVVRLHDWVDTGGMSWSQCRHCEAEGRWDREKFEYVEFKKAQAE